MVMRMPRRRGRAGAALHIDLSTNWSWVRTPHVRTDARLESASAGD